MKARIKSQDRALRTLKRDNPRGYARLLARESARRVKAKQNVPGSRVPVNGTPAAAAAFRFTGLKKELKAARKRAQASA